TVVLGDINDLVRNGMQVSKLNLMKYEHLPQNLETVTQIRYNDAGSLSVLNMNGTDTVDVEFLSNVKGVAPGQSAVFYEGDDVVGGGIIMSSSLSELMNNTN
ncbi:MAG TPA: hypothetical protein PLP81_08080, partial [Saprospiraceae bacterium]|nr:hypothetical protein [Saprospiraceae bacterium]